MIKILGLILLFAYSHSEYLITYSFKNSKLFCSFDLNYTDSTYFEFKFVSCQWKQCSFEAIDSYNKLYCASYQNSTSKDYANCTELCCDSSVTYTQDANAISQCQNYLNRKNSLTSVIVTISILCIVVPLIIIWMTGGLDCLGSCCKRSRMYVMSLITCQRCRNQVQTQSIQNQITMDEIQVEGSKEWKTSESSHLNQTCSICLRLESNLQLRCGHYFHLQCMEEWIKRKRDCANCRNKDINGLILWCTQCKQKWRSTKIGDKDSRKCDKCNKCDKSNEITQIQLTV